VTVWRDRATGKVIMEDWRDQDGQPHRIDGPAYHHIDPKTGVTIHEVWSKHGMNDRDGAPAVIRRDADTGRVTSSLWYKAGQRIARPRPTRPRSKAGGTTPRP
jgi:hypothetical protein